MRDPGGSGCVNGCRKFVVHWQDLNIGTYGVTCASDAVPGGFASGSSINFNGSGQAQISCYQGRDGVNVWIDIHGWGGSVDTEKTFWPRP